jgi:ribose 5-phosphate isomerase B
MLVALASDHAGYELKSHLLSWLPNNGHQPLDLGPDSAAPVDYPDQALLLVQALKQGKAPMGILICGSGQGMAMAANRYPGVRAIVASNEEHARLGRAHNNGNVLCLGGRLTSPEMALRISAIFLTTPFDGGRHQARLDKLEWPAPFQLTGKTAKNVPTPAAQ